MSLSDKAAVITGGGRGIGRATALALAEAGARVTVAARTLPEIESVVAELEGAGHEAWATACDVADGDQIETLAREAIRQMGQVDVLVNCAGISLSAKLEATTLEDWETQMAVNATGTFLCTRAFLPAMLERGWGRVINVASTAGREGMPYVSAYTASKHAVVGFTRSVATETAAYGVTVNALCPGFVDTEMTTDSLQRIVEKTDLTFADARKRLEDMSPQGRMLQPEEVAFMAVSLCDVQAAGINGQAIVMDGGAVQG